MSANAGYHRMHADGVPILSRRVHGSGLPGSCRGECLEIGQQQRPTPLERKTAINGGDITMPRAAPPLNFWITNVGESAANIWALPGVEAFGPVDWVARLHPDQIGSLANSAAFSLAAGASVTLTADRLGHWSSSS